ncbi:MAG: DUF4834 family protein [Muribaculaceae bacterium]|nr:DUF4834 family protein [Muribaculaceae bacterium]
MSFFFLLLLGIFVWVIVIPIIKGVMLVNRVRNNARDMFNRATGRSNNGSQGKTGGNESVKRKKIDSSVGEYVEFEEIQVTQTETQTTADGGQTTYKAESQIVDVEWEEIS